MKLKKCNKCNKNKGLESFYLDKKNNLYKSPCKTCTSIYWKEKWKTKEYKDKYTGWHLKRHYGIDREYFEHMIKNQDNKCKICNLSFGVLKNDKPHVDHCHTSNEVRGLLCSKCNLILGQIYDNTETLKSMINYLEDYNGLREKGR